MTAPLLSAMLWLPVGGGFRLNEWGGFVRFGIGLGGRSVRSGSRAYMSGEYRLYKKTDADGQHLLLPSASIAGAVNSAPCSGC